jgi:hypothetical protein
MQLLERKLQLQARAAPRQLGFANQQRIKMVELSVIVLFVMQTILNACIRHPILQI